MAERDDEFLERLSADQQKGLLETGHKRRYPPGSALVTAGEPSDKVMFVTEGRVKISYFTDEGREVLLAIRGPGTLLGEMSVLDGEPRSATITALEPVEAVGVTADRFNAFLVSAPDISMHLLGILSRRLRDADRKRIEFSAMDTVGRVATRLLELVERFGEPSDEGVRVTLPLSQQDLAGWTGSSREAVSKALQLLRSRGVLNTHRRGMTILDLEELERRAR